jgi:hypothetical protein
VPRESAETGRSRHSLRTGDIRITVYVWDCLTAEARFPTMEVL